MASALSAGNRRYIASFATSGSQTVAPSPRCGRKRESLPGVHRRPVGQLECPHPGAEVHEQGHRSGRRHQRSHPRALRVTHDEDLHRPLHPELRSPAGHAACTRPRDREVGGRGRATLWPSASRRGVRSSQQEGPCQDPWSRANVATPPVYHHPDSGDLAPLLLGAAAAPAGDLHLDLLGQALAVLGLVLDGGDRRLAAERSGCSSM